MSSQDVIRSQRASGASMSATIVGGFGAIWLALGSISAGAPVQAAWPAALTGFALITALGIAVRRRLPDLRGSESPERRDAMRAFAVVNVVQWVGIFSVVNLLHHLHLDHWVIPSIVLIVGAHFLPLARIFRVRAHLVAGIALMMCGVVACLLPVGVRDTVACLGAGSILWASAAYSLYAAFQLAPSMPSARMQRAGL